MPELELRVLILLL